VAKKLKFAHQFSNGAVGTIVVDPRRLRKGAYAIIPNVTGEAPSEECENWMREVMLEVVARTRKTVVIVGPSGAKWRFRPGQRPECLGKGFTSSALFAFEFMRRNRNGGLVQ
jgi:hypothetical protein